MTSMYDEHRCPLCPTVIPLYRALCRPCFDKIPWKMRADFLRAWRLRVADNAAYQEQLVRVHLFNVDAHPIPGLRERTAG